MAYGRVHPLRAFVVILGLAAVIALMGATAGVACVPASARLTSKIVCPKDYQRSVVVRKVWHPEPGATNWDWDLYCVYAGEDDFPVHVSGIVVIGALFGTYFAAELPIIMIMLLGFRMALRRAARKAQ